MRPVNIVKEVLKRVIYSLKRRHPVNEVTLIGFVNKIKKIAPQIYEKVNEMF